MANWFSNLGRKSLVVLLGLSVYGAIIFRTGTACWFQGLLGIPYPGCGTSRAIWALGHGDWQAALRWHPLVFVTIFLFPALALIGVLARRFFFSRWGKGFLGVLLALYLGVYAYRMAVLFPHTAPMIPLPTTLWRLVWHSISNF